MYSGVWRETANLRLRANLEMANREQRQLVAWFGTPRTPRLQLLAHVGTSRTPGLQLLAHLGTPLATGPQLLVHLGTGMNN